MVVHVIKIKYLFKNICPARILCRGGGGTIIFIIICSCDDKLLQKLYAKLHTKMSAEHFFFLLFHTNVQMRLSQKPVAYSAKQSASIQADAYAHNLQYLHVVTRSVCRMFFCCCFAS